MNRRQVLTTVAIVAAIPATGWLFTQLGRSAGGLLNVSYDPTRELWRALNTAFQHLQLAERGRVGVHMSHGGSSSQARAVIDGLPADVVTLALWSDTDMLRAKGLLRTGWDQHPPNGLPYLSTIVFVVRAGNPKNVRTWADLARPGIGVITPNPKTSGNGKLSFLAAWGAILQAGGSPADARAFVTALYRNTPVLDTGARSATTSFTQRHLGDVHLTWENEAHQEVDEARHHGQALEIVYPECSLRAEPYVALVDANVEHNGTRALAEAYLQFLYTPTGQEIIAAQHYRPLQAQFAQWIPPMPLFSITRVADDWHSAQQMYFAEGAVFDQIYEAGR
jgi:sulfate transport system substrate-binding protein